MDSEIADTQNAFSSLSAAFLAKPDTPPDRKALRAAATSLKRSGFDTLFLDFYFDALQEQAKNGVAQQFWQVIDQFKTFSWEPSRDGRRVVCSRFAEAVRLVHAEVCQMANNTRLLASLLGDEDTDLGSGQFASVDLFVSPARPRPPPTCVQPKPDSSLFGLPSSCCSEAALLSRLSLCLYPLFFSSIPDHFSRLLSAYFDAQFGFFQTHVRLQRQSLGAVDSDDDGEGQQEQGEGEQNENEESVASPEGKSGISNKLTELEKELDSFRTVAAQLQAMRWLEVTAQMYTDVLLARIEGRIEKCKGSEDARGRLPSVLHWVDKAVLPWLRKLLCAAGENEHSLSSFQQWKCRLEYFTYERFAQLRIAELFDTISLFHEEDTRQIARDHIQDLKECLQKSDQTADLIRSLAATLQDRLLHPGADTESIIKHYISMIEALRVLDPSGVILEAVSPPVRLYLRGREDTLKHVVSMMSRLLQDLPEHEYYKEAEDGDEDEDEAEEEEGAGSQWVPDHVDADPNRSRRSRTSGDTLGMLANIYGSNELFVTELQSQLATRLLTQQGYDTHQEVINLELLKKRFGEASLHSCEVMVKDMSDSRRDNGNIKAQLLSDPKHAVPDVPESAVNVTIISKEYWPNLPEESFRLPAPIARMLARYADRYEQLKARKLLWRADLGTVTLDMAIGDSVTTMTVTPLQASILWHFQDKIKWSLSGLAAVLDMVPATLRRHMQYWVRRGRLLEHVSPAKADGGYEYELNTEEPDEIGSQGEPQVLADDGNDESKAEAQEAKRRALAQEFEDYAIGMLRGGQALPVDRIFSGVRMWMANSHLPVTQDETDLQAFLTRQVQAGILECEDQLFRLRTDKLMQQ